MNQATQKKSPGDTQAQVLSATLSLFSKQGYFNASVHDIARQAGVSIGSIYHHFKDKEGIAKALYSDMVERMSTELMEIRQTHSTAHDRCRAVVELLFKITLNEPDIMEFMLYSKHREFLPDEPPVCSSKPFEIMREFVRQGIATGEIREMDLMVASTCLFGGPMRMITSSLDGLLEKPLSNYMDEIWCCSWKAISSA